MLSRLAPATVTLRVKLLCLTLVCAGMARVRHLTLVAAERNMGKLPAHRAGRSRVVGPASNPKPVPGSSRQRHVDSRSRVAKALRPSYPAEASLEVTKLPDATGKAADESDGTTSEDDVAEEVKKRSRTLQDGRRLSRRRRHGVMLSDSSNPKITLQRASFLEKQAVSQKTAKRYLAVIMAFIAWADKFNLKLSVDDEVDGGMATYLNHLFQMGHDVHAAEFAVAALMHVDPGFARRGGRHMPRTMRALKGYRRLAPRRSRVPHPLATWMALAADLADRGFTDMAVFTLIMVQGYLRPMETLRLTPSSFVPPVCGSGRFWSLLLHPQALGISSKVGEYDESLLMDAPWATWMNHVFEILSRPGPAGPDACVWNFSYPQFSRQLSLSCQRLGISLVPYQARHSGASHDRLERLRSSEELQKRGRWASIKSVMRYEKAALISKTFLNYPAATQTWLKARELDYVDVVLRSRPLASPPPFA